MGGTGITKRQKYYDSEHDKDSDLEGERHQESESPRKDKGKKREWNRDDEPEKGDSRDRSGISKRYDDIKDNRRDARRGRNDEEEDFGDKGRKYKHDYSKDDKRDGSRDNNDVGKGSYRDKSGKRKYDDVNDRKDSRKDEHDVEKGGNRDRGDRYNYDDRRERRSDEDDNEEWDDRDRVDKQGRNSGGKDHRRERKRDDGVGKRDNRERGDRYNNDDNRAGRRDEDDADNWDHQDRAEKQKTYYGRKDGKGERHGDDGDFEKGEYRERVGKYSKYDDEKDDRRERQRERESRKKDKRNDDNGDIHARRSENGMSNNLKIDDKEKDLSTVKNPESNVIPDANLGRSGGIYIPPYKLARMMKDIQDKSSIEYQRMTWDALRKSINGLVNKVNATNIKNIIPELFGENLIRGRGLFCRSCMKSQMASPGFTDVFAALVSVLNTKFPEIGDLLLRRIILQFQRAYKRNDKPQLLAAVKFIAHLVNQQVVHELIALELLALLLEKATDDSVEVAVGFITECGAILQDLSPRGLNAIFDRFRGILTEGQIDMRVQFLIESLFGLRRAKFQDHPAVRPELDLVEEEDQLTHEVSLSDEIDPEIALDIFKPDPQFTENEKHYEELKKQMLGEESDDNDASDAEDDSDEEEEDESEEEEEKMKIKDETETNLINLRRTIYLTIMSSATYEEAGHKLLCIKLEPGQEMELCIMLLECCSQERTYLRFYGLLGGTLCMKKKIYQENFDTCFVQQYSMIHRLETNKLRNVAKFFGHLLGTDKLPWHVLSYIRLTEEDTTSSSRIFIKILFQEMSEHLGIRQLNERLNDPSMQDSFESIFPKDNPKNTRFSINFFTSIGLGGITESLREYLKNMPRLIMQQQTAAVSESDGTSGSDSDGSGSSATSSESDSDDGRQEKRKRRRRSR